MRAEEGRLLWGESGVLLPVFYSAELPRVPPGKAQRIIARELGPKGTETVLLVEDEEQVRGILTDMLESQGYHVVVASDGNGERGAGLVIEEMRLVCH